MATAIETALPGFRPNRLQQAAIERIQHFQEELKQYGVYMRSSMELEFMVEDRFGQLTSHTINLKEAEKYLKMPENRLPHLESFKTDITSEYEVTVSDHFTSGQPVGSDSFSPLAIASETALLKKSALQDLLKQTTCLNPAATGKSLLPVFRAYPFSQASKDSPWHYEERSSALHINVSLYDKNGKNLFASSPKLCEECARSLVDIQHEAGLAFLPKNNSLKRLRPEAHLSVPGGIGMEDSPDSGKRRFSSVNIRRSLMKSGNSNDRIQYKDETRIENRLPGADADPFVAMAVTMAAMVDALAYEQRTSLSQPPPRHAFAHNRTELAKTLRASMHMRELLGTKLHDAILQGYESSILRN